MIITVGNNKGGTGKTAVTAHLGVALGKLGYKTLIIDNDPQCNCTSLISREYKKTMFDLYSTEIDESFNIKDFITLTKYQNCDLIANSVETSGFSLEWMKNFPDCLNELKKRIVPYTDNYDYVLIDTPPSLDVMLSISLNASQVVVIPIEVSSLHSLEGLDKVLDLISAMQETNEDLRFLKLVMNKADRRTSVSKVLINRVLSDYGPKYCFNTILPICTALQQAEYLHKTVFLHKPNEKITTLFKDLAAELVKETKGKL